MGVRIVVEIPHAFAEYCKALGDKPADVILDLIDECLDPVVDDSGPVQAERPPPAADGRGLPEIAEFLREPADPGAA